MEHKLFFGFLKSAMMCMGLLLSSSMFAQNKQVAQDFTIPYMNGTMHVTIYKDGSSTGVISTPCILCKGTGTCNVCSGQGGTYNWVYNYWTVCPSCCGSKSCKYCQGRGKSVMVKSLAPGEAEAYARTKSGSSSSGRSGSRSNDGYEVIEYAPNYTGRPDDVYCDKCKRMAPRHSHVWKR